MMAKILIVDDFPDTLELFRDVLTLYGFEVVEANDGEMALQIARREKPDLILMDVSLPHMDGYTATRKIKAEPALATIPIVFVSAHVLERQKLQALEVGGAGYINKPIDIHHFVDRVNHYLSLTQMVE